MHTDKIFFIIY